MLWEIKLRRTNRIGVDRASRIQLWESGTDMSDLGVTVATWNRFHMFNLAAELKKRGLLRSLITTLPSRRAIKEAQGVGIPEEKLYCNSMIWMMSRGADKLLHNESLNSLFAVLNTVSHQAYIEELICRDLKHTRLLIGLSGTGYKGGKLLKENEKYYIFDRGSPEIRYVDSLNKDLSETFGCKRKAIHPRLIDNETKEAEIAHQIVVPSTFCKYTYEKAGYDSKKITVIPYGADLMEFSGGGIRENRGYTYLFCGNFSFMKGASHLVDIFTGHEAPGRLKVVGNVEDDIKEYLTGKDISRIDFEGIVSRKEVSNYMRSATCLLLPSYQDGLAMVIPQALACGLPVIASKQSGAPEYIQDGINGLILRSVSSSEIMRCMDLLEGLTKSEYLDMSERCAESMCKVGGWEQYGTAWEMLIKNIVKFDQ